MILYRKPIKAQTGVKLLAEPHTISKKDAMAQIADSKSFLKNYYNSNKFKHRFDEMTKSTEISSDPSKLVSNGDNVNLYYTDLGAIPTKIAGLGELPTQGINKIKTYYDKTNNNVFINRLYNEVNKIPFAESGAHEISHAYSAKNFIPESFSKILKEKQIGNNSAHDKDPVEVKADIDAYRYLLYKLNIYDAGKHDFKQDHLNKSKKKLKNSFIFKRLSKQYNDADLIWIMNNLAKNSNAENAEVFG